MSDLDFEILFIENDEDFVDSVELILTKFLNNLGFIPKITKIKGKDFKAANINETTDLILIDLNLNDDVIGSSLIEDIRKCKNLSDIIFYSDALADFDSALESLGNPEGVYLCRGRKDLLPKIEALITKTIKKQQEISNLRGLVISEVIDLEAKMTKIIIKFFNLSGHPHEDIFYEKILDPETFMLGKKSNFMNTICKEVIKDLSNKMTNAKGGDREKKLIESIQRIHTECAKIDDEIVIVRNILAHAKPIEGDPTALKSIRDGKITKIDANWCANTRKNIIKHSKNLDELSSQLDES